MAKKWKERLILPAFLLILLVFGLLVLRHPGQEAPAPVAKPASAPASLPRREVVLYFMTADGRQLAAERRELAGCDDERRCLVETVTALLQGPRDPGLLPLFSPRTTVRGASVEGATALVDLSRAAQQEHPGGSMTELLTMTGLANSVVANAPGLREVRLLVEGQPVPTLKGHVDLRQPLPADFDRVRGDSRP